MITVKEFIKDEKLYYSDFFVSDPVVSIVMPTYCRGDNGLLKRAIDSVLEQTFTSFELIIVDDGSVDGTQSLIKKYLNKDKRILYIRNECNSGLPAIRVNQGILHARGKYIAYQFDDDRWTKEGLELLVDEIEKQKELTLVYGQWEYYDVKQRISGVLSEEFNYSKLIVGNYIANNSVIHHREICAKYGMYDCSLLMRRLCDWDLWLRWAKEINFIHLKKLVSLVEMYVDNSLGTTVTYDLYTSRLIMGEERNSLLTPDLIQNYEVDSLSSISCKELKNKTYNKHILPWKLRHIDLYPNETIYTPPILEKQRVILTKFEYDSVVNIMVENFISLRKDSYQLMYVPEEQLQYDYLLDGDILILCRATTQTTLDIVNRVKAEKRGISVVYFIDDDLLNIYKLGVEFSYIEPGTSMYLIVENLLRLSDRVVAFSNSIAKTVETYNKNITVLKTNILSKYLSKEDNYYEGETFNIIFMGGAARKEEFSVIQDDLIQICKKYKNKVSFTFMGYIPEKMKNVKDSRVTYIEYTTAYYHYLNRLATSKYNLMLCPLYDNEFNRGKSPVKLLEACCCGAIGLYSDVSVYECIEDGVHGYKIKNGDSWFNKIEQIIKSPVNEKQKILNQAISMVKENYTTEKLLPQFELALKTVKLANYVQNRIILYVSHSGYLAGAENHLFRHCLLSKQAGFKVIFALPSSVEGQKLAMEKMAVDNNIEVVYLNYLNFCEVELINKDQAVELGKQILQTLSDYNIALIHSCTLIPAMGYVASKLNIPYISSLYQTESDFICQEPSAYFAPDYVHSDSVLYANMWQDKLSCPSRCIRSYIPNEFFKSRKAKKKSTYRIAISGTLQERKRQLKLIEAIGLLKNNIDIELYLFGYDHFFPEYKMQCIEMAHKYEIEEKVFFKGLVSNLYDILSELDIDIVVCASTFESFPQVILEAMALEIPVVSTPVAGVPELISKKTGFLSAGFEASDISIAIKECINSIEMQEIQFILMNAKLTLERECSFYNVSYQLFDIYYESFIASNKCLQNTKANNEQIVCEITNNSRTDIRNDSRIIESDMLVYSNDIKEKRSYNITCEIKELNKIGIIFASISKETMKGVVIMKLLTNGRLLRNVKLPIEEIVLDNWNYFKFETLHGVQGKVLTIELIFDYQDSPKEMGVYENKYNRTFMYKVFNKLSYPIKGMNALYVDCQY